MEEQVFLDCIVTPNNELLITDLPGGEAAILDMESGIYYGLNAVGTRIWRLLAEAKKLTSIHELLAQEYPAESERLNNDICEFVRGVAVKLCAELRIAV